MDLLELKPFILHTISNMITCARIDETARKNVG